MWVLCDCSVARSMLSSSASRPTGLVMKSHAPARIAEIAGLIAQVGKPIIIAWIPEQLEGPGAVAADASPTVPIFRSMRRLMRAVQLWHQYWAGQDRTTPEAPAGLAAALGARRAGADVILMERFGCFGGVITTVGMETLAWYR